MRGKNVLRANSLFFFFFSVVVLVNSIGSATDQKTWKPRNFYFCRYSFSVMTNANHPHRLRKSLPLVLLLYPPPPYRPPLPPPYPPPRPPPRGYPTALSLSVSSPRFSKGGGSKCRNLPKRIVPPTSRRHFVPGERKGGRRPLVSMCGRRHALLNFRFVSGFVSLHLL